MKIRGFPGGSESQVEPHPEHRRRVWPGCRRVENLDVHGQMRRCRNRDVVEGFEALAKVVDAKNATDPAALNANIEIPEPKRVVVATGDDSTPTQAETGGEARRVGVIIGDPNTSENSDSLMIRFTIAQMDQTLGFAFRRGIAIGSRKPPTYRPDSKC